MSIKKKNYFISVLREDRKEHHKVLINERFFNLNDIEKWRLYTKLILQYVNYLYEINDKDINLFLRGVIKEVNEESKKFKRRMGYELGDWRQF